MNYETLMNSVKRAAFKIVAAYVMIGIAIVAAVPTIVIGEVGDYWDGMEWKKYPPA